MFKIFRDLIPDFSYGPKLKLKEIDPDYGMHELLHTSSVIVKLFDEEILEHQDINRDEEIHKLALEAFDKLFDLYQVIGVKHLS